jgi:hypothetical protein
LNCSPEAARGLVEEAADTRKLGSDGKALVADDVTKLTHRPMSARSPPDHRPVTTTLNARVHALPR